jgi:hypothetical protein
VDKSKELDVADAFLSFGNEACSILKYIENTDSYNNIKLKLPPKYCISGEPLQKTSMIWKKLPPKR